MKSYVIEGKPSANGEIFAIVQVKSKAIVFGEIKSVLQPCEAGFLHEVIAPTQVGFSPSTADGFAGYGRI